MTLVKNDWTKKIILVDFDGVMVDFTQAFDLTMIELGYEIISNNQYSLYTRYNCNQNTIKDILHEFVHSEEMANLPPLYQSLKYIRLLREKGYIFHCITAASSSIREYRLRNAEMLYGDGIFQRLECVGVDSDKSTALSKYQGTGCWWIEDKPENAELGLKYGLKPILLLHPYNQEAQVSSHVNRCVDWKAIYNLIEVYEEWS